MPGSVIPKSMAPSTPRTRPGMQINPPHRERVRPGQLKWTQLPARSAHTLILLRSQATHIARHADHAKLHRAKLQTREECFCPLCLDGAGREEHLEDTFHVLLRCPFVREQRADLHAAAQAGPTLLRTSCSRAPGPLDGMTRRLPAGTQHKLLLGNVPPASLFKASSLTGNISNGAFVQGLVAATTRHVHAILKQRTKLARHAQQDAAAPPHASAAT